MSFWVLYIALGIVWGFLMTRYARRGLELEHEVPDAPTDAGCVPPRSPALTY